MPISNQTPIIGYVANGVTKSFAFPFAILSADDLKVKVGADVVTTGFSIAGVGDRDGGSVTFTDAPASPTPIILYREVTLDRTTDYQENGDLLAIVLDDDLDRIWMALQDQLLLSDRALRSPLGETLQQLPPASERALMALAFDAAGNPIVVRGTNDGGAALALDLMDTAPGKGAALVGYDDGTAQAVLDDAKPLANYGALRAYTGRATGVRITQPGLAGFFQRDDADTSSADNGGTIIVDGAGRRWKRVGYCVVLSDWFGPDKAGAVNATAELKAFFDFCISTMSRGRICAGTYLITEGQLAFDNGHADTPWPEIETDGFEAVVFKAAGANDAPMLSITNGTAVSDAGKYWFGGSLGGITFMDATGATAPNRHGILLRGLWGTKFGTMAGEGLRGDVVHIEQKLYATNNPDPYHVAGCEFESIRGLACVGRPLNNQNFVGFNSNRIGYFFGNQCGGGWFGLGALNSVKVFGMANSTGWAIDDVIAATGGASSRLTIESAEFDNMEDGIRMNLIQQVDIKNLRIIHRFQSGLNTSANYWPRTALSFGTLGAANVSGININVFHRFEAGGVLADLGVIANFNSNSNVNTIKLDQRIADNGSLGVGDANLFSNISANSAGIVVTNRGKLIADTRRKVAAYVTATASQTVPNSGIGTAAARISFPTVQYDGASYYSANEFTAPYTGLYRLSACVNLALAVGTRVRMEFTRDRSGTLAPVVAKAAYSVNANACGYALEGVALLQAGDKVSLLADQNTAGAVALSVVRGAAAENYMSIEAL